MLQRSSQIINNEVEFNETNEINLENVETVSETPIPVQNIDRESLIKKELESEYLEFLRKLRKLKDETDSPLTTILLKLIDNSADWKMTRKALVENTGIGFY